MIPPDAVELIEHLWPVAPPDGTAVFVLTFVEGRPKEDGTPRQWPAVAATWDGWKWHQTRDVGPQTYLSAAAWDARCTRKAAYADVRCLRAVWADIDPTPDEERIDSEAMRLRLYKAGLPCTVVDSGRGCQVWQGLDEDLIVADPKATKAMLQRFGRAVAEVVGHEIDRSCAEPSRILRCPGTVNTKTGREAQLHFRGERLSHAELGAWLDRHVPRDPEPWRPPAVVSEAKVKKWHRKALDALASHPVGCRGYNELCHLTGVKLRDAGHDAWMEAEATIARLSATGCAEHNIDSFRRGVKG